MALIDVNMVSGFEPIIHQLDVDLQSDRVAYTQYEFDDGLLSFYFDEVSLELFIVKLDHQSNVSIYLAI